MRKTLAVAWLLMLVVTSSLFADVSLTDKGAALKKAAKGSPRAGGSVLGHRLVTNAAGTLNTLVDAGGLRYFIDTNITTNTSSSASAAASEANYTVPIAASTGLGGSVMATLTDTFDGYNSLCVSLTNAQGPCTVPSVSYTSYFNNGAPVVDAGVPALPECTNRQYVFNAQPIGGLSVRRKVYVPTNDRYIRWANIFTNTTGAPITFSMVTSNNLGSDTNTMIVSSSSGDAAAQTTDTWVTTFQDFSLNLSSDPRIGHVLQGVGAPTPVSNVLFANGDDNPYWAYTITLNPGQTKIIVNFATALGTKAAAATQAAALASFGPVARQCFTATELGQIVNFALNADLSITKTANTATAFGGNNFSYTLSVTNAGPATATSVSVTDTLPAGSGFVSATGTGWTCNNVAGTVTCTMPSLPVGPAAPITLTITAPAVTSGGTLSNTATVSAATVDPTPANASNTSVAPILPGSAIPTMSPGMLALMAAALALTALLMIRRQM